MHRYSYADHRENDTQLHQLAGRHTRMPGFHTGYLLGWGAVLSLNDTQLHQLAGRHARMPGFHTGYLMGWGGGAVQLAGR